MDIVNKKKLAAFVSVVSNSSLIVLKLIAGAVSGSISIISEAIHSFSDLLASFLAYFSVSRSGEPPDEEHPFGHGKFEDLSGLIEGALIILASFYIIYEAVKKILTPENSLLDLNLALAVMIISVFVNTFVSIYLFKIAKETDSIALFADAEHLRTDIFSSLAVALGLFAIKVTGIHILDPIFAMIVAGIILRAGFSICKTTTGNLLDTSLPSEIRQTILAVVESYLHKGISGYKELKTRKAGMKKQIAMTLLFEPGVSIRKAHQLCDEIEHDLESRLGNTDVLIHIEPFN